MPRLSCERCGSEELITKKVIGGEIAYLCKYCLNELTKTI